MCVLCHIFFLSVFSFSSNTYHSFCSFKVQWCQVGQHLWVISLLYRTWGWIGVSIDFKLDYLSEITSKTTLLYSVFQKHFLIRFSHLGKSLIQSEALQGTISWSMIWWSFLHLMASFSSTDLFVENKSHMCIFFSYFFCTFLSLWTLELDHRLNNLYFFYSHTHTLILQLETENFRVIVKWHLTLENFVFVSKNLKKLTSTNSNLLHFVPHYIM